MAKTVEAPAKQKVKLSQMHRFVCLADELHFGRAATKAGVAQPPFSLSIKQLERALGVVLVNRTHHSVSLTPAGEAFAREARSALRQVEISEKAAQRAAAGEVSELRIGFTEPALFRILPAILRGLREAGIDARLPLSEHTSPEVVERLQQNKLDLGIFLPRMMSTDGLETRIVESVPLVACLSAESPLAQLDRLRLRDLQHESFIMYPPNVQPGIHETILAACLKAGFTPRIERQSLRAMTMLNLVIAGLGVAFVPETAKYSHLEGLKYMPVDDMPDIQRQLIIGWRAENMSPGLSALIGFALAGGSGTPKTP